MGFKITLEVDGQTEQQLAPIVSRIMALHPELRSEGAGNPVRPNHSFYHENSALLQQHVQQLTHQNKLLQEQLSYSQRLLAGAPASKALPAQIAVPVDQQQNTSLVNETTVRTASVSPPLPARYQRRSNIRSLEQMKRPFKATAQGFGKLLLWTWQGKGWPLIFLLMSGMMYGSLSVAPLIANRLWKPPEFVDSPKSGPGDTVSPTNSASDKTAETEGKRGSTGSSANPSGEAIHHPATPASKAGSHSPPPPAFQQ